jgi:hypothetical protein
MKTFNTLQELYDATQPHQVTAQHVINRRAWVEGEWQDIELSPELHQSMCDDISELFGGRQATKDAIYRRLYRERPQHWGLDRTVIFDYGRGAKWRYITGQDQTWEDRQIRNDLKH